MNEFRVFISYSRSDRGLVECLDEVFSKARIDAMWDKDLVAGLRFNDQIKSHIEHAHVFAPVISGSSAQSVWVHAEIG